jgi:hypothetical protein
MKFDSKPGWGKKPLNFLHFPDIYFLENMRKNHFASWLGVGEGKLGVLDYL